MNDEFYMKRALILAAKARHMTSPNPMVGALITKYGRILSEDFHKKPGTLHAEVLAIEKAGKDAQGSTLYINLEPCCHSEKRTPPCTKAIIKSGIREVVIGMIDPNPKVSGKGILELHQAGIKVRFGVLEGKAKRLNEAYTKYITTGKPFVILKIAMTLDGKIATPEGQSQWITSEKARRLVHRLRSSVDAIITAIGTIRTDNPELTARIKGGKKPRRIIIDPNLKIPLNAKVLQVPPETILITRVENNKSNTIENSGVKILYFKNKLDLNWLMERIGEKEISSALIEGGSSLNAHALEEGIVDKVVVFIAPKIIGGRESFPAVGGKSFKRLEEAYRLRDVITRQIGEDILIEGYIEK